MNVHIFLYVRWCICLDTVCLELNFLNSQSNPMKQNKARIANIKYWQCGELSPMVWPPSSISLQSWAGLHPHQSSPTVCLMKTYQQQNLQVDIKLVLGAVQKLHHQLPTITERMTIMAQGCQKRWFWKSKLEAERCCFSWQFLTNGDMLENINKNWRRKAFSCN